mmetsp:Transcript_1278/g.3829  ORF Transcript_1278/g.3829 Transcript_1278/m.3829 type:complete len:610 (-) Transcript_1278:1119-2948(-)
MGLLLKLPYERRVDNVLDPDEPPARCLAQKVRFAHTKVHLQLVVRVEFALWSQLMAREAGARSEARVCHAVGVLPKVHNVAWQRLIRVVHDVLVEADAAAHVRRAVARRTDRVESGLAHLFVVDIKKDTLRRARRGLDVLLQRVGRIEAVDCARAAEQDFAHQEAVGALGVDLLRRLARVGRKVNAAAEQELVARLGQAEAVRGDTVDRVRIRAMEQLHAHAIFGWADEPGCLGREEVLLKRTVEDLLDLDHVDRVIVVRLHILLDSVDNPEVLSHVAPLPLELVLLPSIRPMRELGHLALDKLFLQLPYLPRLAFILRAGRHEAALHLFFFRAQCFQPRPRHAVLSAQRLLGISDLALFRLQVFRLLPRLSECMVHLNLLVLECLVLLAQLLRDTFVLSTLFSQRCAQPLGIRRKLLLPLSDLVLVPPPLPLDVLLLRQRLTRKSLTLFGALTLLRLPGELGCLRLPPCELNRLESVEEWVAQHLARVKPLLTRLLIGCCRRKQALEQRGQVRVLAPRLNLRPTFQLAIIFANGFEPLPVSLLLGRTFGQTACNEAAHTEREHVGRCCRLASCQSEDLWRHVKDGKHREPPSSSAQLSHAKRAVTKLA